ncbi:MAG: DNA adenine methylase, partial [Candidatus Heimdallarchaeota archaeon]|nr:DNA adenine methylase [Candidatus Heimdallarchaeota archaeon]
PYDSTFKNYGNNVFDKKDQIRLSTFLTNCSANWLLIIQGNGFVTDLYKQAQVNDPNIEIIRYDKQYTYNVRGRNERETSHLLIKNFK